MKEEKVHPRLLVEKPAFHAPHKRKRIRTMNRKDFFKTGGRIFLLGGMAAAAGYLVVNKKVSANCSVSPACNSCGINTDCINPEVKTERGKKTP
jgi:hypothetical protein